MRYWIVDALATQPFMGNPACVVEPFEAWPNDGLLQSIAREASQPMTAFLRHLEAPDHFHLRWFTATREMTFCGHATFACSHVLFSGSLASANSIHYETLAGPISVVRSDEDYQISFPADPPRSIPEPEELSAALGAQPKEILVGRHLVALLADAKSVRNIKPDMAALKKIVGADFGPGHVSVVAPADDEPADFVMRCFLPGGEDLATGSLVCIVAPTLAARSRKHELRFHQVPPGRGAWMTARVEAGRVAIRGSALTIARGEWLI